jgi:hypothetical protein
VEEEGTLKQEGKNISDESFGLWESQSSITDQILSVVDHAHLHRWGIF